MSDSVTINITETVNVVSVATTQANLVTVQSTDTIHLDLTSGVLSANFVGIPGAQVNSDWNSNSGVSEILNKPPIIGMRMKFSTINGESEPASGKFHSVDSGPPSNTEFMDFSQYDLDGNDLQFFWNLMQTFSVGGTLQISWDGGSCGFRIYETMVGYPNYGTADCLWWYGDSYPVNDTECRLLFNIMPQRAIGTEINTGTEERKWVTPKAIADSNLILDAPVDGNTYARKNGAWIQIA